MCRWKPKVKEDKKGHCLVFYAKPVDVTGARLGLKANLKKNGALFDCEICGGCTNCLDRFKLALEKVKHGPIDDWHFKILDNLDKTVAKALSRNNLQFSSQVPTLSVSLKNIVNESDYRKKHGLPPITHIERKDGTGSISPDLLEQVWLDYLRKTGGKYRGYTPSLFQGRIGPSKGIWTVNPHLPTGTIFIREGQSKYNLKRPDEMQRTIEVCKFFVDVGPHGINKQLVVALEPRLRDPSVLNEILSEALEQTKEVCT